MAYAGYLIQVGSYTIPNAYIKTESYSVTYNTMDLEPYRDADGVLHRNALPHKAVKIEFETPIMYASDFATFINNIRAQYLDAVEKDLMATFYVFELDDYVTQKVYVPDITTEILQNSKQGFVLNPCRLAFIGY